MNFFRTIICLVLGIAIPVESFLGLDGQILKESHIQKMKMFVDKQLPELSDGREQFSLPWLKNHKVIDYVKNIQQPKLLNPVSKLGDFKWNSCNAKKNPLMNLKSLTISPDKLHFPGSVYFQFTAFIKKTIDAPLQVNMTLKKEITSSFWLKIPCIDGIGSCNIDDLCETLEGATCPMPFIKYDIPCKCPFEKGSYKMQKSGININVKDIPTGNYYLKLDVGFQQQAVTCIEIHFTIV